MQQAARFNLHDARRLPAPLQSPAGAPVLYTHVLCPYAQRVLMALLHKVGRAAIWASPALQPALQPRCRAHTSCNALAPRGAGRAV